MTTLRRAGCVFAEDEARLLVDAAREQGWSSEGLAGQVRRRAGGEPLEYVLGWAEFGGLRIAVEPGVFVPRRRTEFLVECAVRLAGGLTGGRRAVAVDLCCGSGALGRVIAEWLGGAELYSCDVDPVAVACAARNVAAVGGRASVGDLDAALPRGIHGRVDVLAANVPYVPTGEIDLMPAEARDHEPRVALDGGDDGLGVLRRVASIAPGWLSPGGCVLVEVSRRQVSAGRAAFVDAGLRTWSETDEDRGATVLIGQR